MRIFLLMLLTTIMANGQTDSTAVKKNPPPDPNSDNYIVNGLMTGVHISNRPAVEIGCGRLSVSDVHSKIGPITSGYCVSVENYFIPQYIMAPKISFFANGIINFGANIIWHTDLEGGSALKFRPEIGFGFEGFRMNFGLNVPVYKHLLSTGLPDGMLSVNYCVPLRKKKQK